MSLTQRISNAIRGFNIDVVKGGGPIQTRAGDPPSVNGPTNHIVDSLNLKKLPRRGTAELINAYNTNPRLRFVLEKIAYSESIIPWQLFAARGADGKSFVRRRDLSYGLHETREEKLADGIITGEVEEITSHPILDMLDRGNTFMDGCTAQKIMQVYYDLKGEMFAQIQRRDTSVKAMQLPEMLWPIPPHWVRKIGNENTPYELMIGAKTIEIPADEMIYLRNPDPLNPYGRGTGVGETLADELDTDEYAAQYIKNFFGNGAITPFIMSFVDEKNADNLKTYRLHWDQHHRTVTGKGHRPEFVNGHIQVERFDSAFDTKMLDLRNHERDIVIQTFNVPPEIVGVTEASNRAKIETARIIFAADVIVPRREAKRAWLQRTIVDAIDDRLILGYPSPVPEDKEVKREFMTAAPYNFPVDEWQRSAGVPVDPEMVGTYRVPMNLIDVTTGGEGEKAIVIRSTRALTAINKKLNTPVTIGGDTKALSDDDIYRIANDVDDAHMLSALEPEMTNLVKVFGKRGIDDLDLDDLPEFNDNASAVQTFLRTWAGDKIPKIGNTTKEALRKTLAEGVADGEGIEKLTNRVKDLFKQAKRYRHRRIAKTEVNTGSNWAITQGQKQSGVVTQRQWIPAFRNTRPSHAAMDQQIRGIDQPFTLVSGDNTGATAMQPGGFGIASEDVSCECTTIAIIKDPITEEAVLEAVWKSFQSEVEGWKRRFRKAAKSAFSQQEADVLEAMNRYG